MKRIKKFITYVMCGVVLISGSVFAENKSFSFSLTNSGTQYQKLSTTYNKKTIKSDPWTIKVNSITCAGNYGVSFCPVKYKANKNTIVKYCTSSARWINGTGGAKTTKFASQDAAIIEYKLAARMDDDYHTTFKAAGWFNADNTAK